MTEEQLKDLLCTIFESNKATWGLSDITDINLVWFWFTIPEYGSDTYFTAFYYVGSDENADEIITK